MKSIHDFKSVDQYKEYLRTYFAAIAMQAIIPSYMSKPVSLDDIDSPQRLASQWSIKFADELLKQLEDGNNKS